MESLQAQQHRQAQEQAMIQQQQQQQYLMMQQQQQQLQYQQYMQAQAASAVPSSSLAVGEAVPAAPVAATAVAMQSAHYQPADAEAQMAYQRQQYMQYMYMQQRYMMAANPSPAAATGVHPTPSASTAAYQYAVAQTARTAAPKSSAKKHKADPDVEITGVKKAKLGKKAQAAAAAAAAQAAMAGQVETGVAAAAAAVAPTSSAAYHQQAAQAQHDAYLRQVQASMNKLTAKAASKAAGGQPSAKPKKPKAAVAHTPAMVSLSQEPSADMLDIREFKHIIQRAIPQQFPIEKAATKNIAASAVEFINLITSEANHLRKEEAKLKSQISVRTSIERTNDSSVLSQKSTAAGLVPINLIAERLYDIVVPVNGEEVLPGKSLEQSADGSVLMGKHVLAALANLGFREYAAVLAMHMDAIARHANESAEAADVASDEMNLASKARSGHPPAPVSAPIPNSGAQPMRDTSNTFANVMATDVDRAKNEQQTPLHASKAKWMSLMHHPLYPPHPLTKPGYTPQPCVFGEKCIEKLTGIPHAYVHKQRHAPRDDDASPHKPSRKSQSTNAKPRRPSGGGAGSSKKNPLLVEQEAQAERVAFNKRRREQHASKHGQAAPAVDGAANQEPIATETDGAATSEPMQMDTNTGIVEETDDSPDPVTNQVAPAVA